MYRCQKCGKVSGANKRANFVTTLKKKFKHPERPYGNFVKGDDGKWFMTPDRGGVGYQIVKEIRVCEKCKPTIPEAKIVS